MIRTLLAAAAICAVAAPAMAQTVSERVEAALRAHYPECLVPASELTERCKDQIALLKFAASANETWEKARDEDEIKRFMRDPTAGSVRVYRGN